MVDGSAKATSSKRRLWSWLIAVPLVLAVAAYLGLEISGRISLSRAMQVARAGGEPLTYKEIQARRRVWPPEQDGGLAFTTLRPRLAELRKDKESLEALPILGNVLSPPLGHRWPVEVQDAAVAALTRMGKEIDGLDRLGGYPGGSLPLVIPRTGKEAIDVGAAEREDVRFATKLKALQAVSQAMQGDTSHTAGDVTVMVRLGNLVSDYPAICSSLMKIAMDAMVVETLQQTLAVASIAPADLQLIESLLCETEAVDPLYWGVLGDRAMFVVVAGEMVQTGSGASPNAWLRRDEACCLGLYNRLVEIAKMPRGRPEAAQQLRSEAEALPPRYLLTVTYCPSFERAFVLGVMSTAQLRAARVGSAAERYRLETGSLPQQLSQLIPKYLSQIPLDPFDEEPLRYRLTDRAAKVYSVGADGIDDGGDLAEWREKKPGKDCGFILLRPEFRNLPPVSATQPTASGAATTREG